MSLTSQNLRRREALAKLEAEKVVEVVVEETKEKNVKSKGDK